MIITVVFETCPDKKFIICNLKVCHKCIQDAWKTFKESNDSAMLKVYSKYDYWYIYSHMNSLGFIYDYARNRKFYCKL